MSNRATRRKIAILGGGPAGLSAAFHLTSQPGWQDRYDVTVYQMGWRLGGKCATGREQDSKRIQEHGIHLFSSFYANTFAMMRDAYAELYGPTGSERADEPLRTVDDAFVPNTFLLYTERWNGRVVSHDMWPPDDDEHPWDRDVQLSMASFLTELLDGMLTMLTNHHVAVTQREVRFFRRVVALPLVRVIARRFEKFASSLTSGRRDAARSADRIARWMQRSARILTPFAKHLSSLRWKVLQLDVLGTLLRGVIDDRLLEDNLDSIDGMTDREWLAKHGATKLLVDSRLVETVSNICFEYEDGDWAQGPRMSARAFVSFQLRAMLGKGRAMYYFRAGTGESVVSPLYRALVERGVKFEFFHKITALHTSSSGGTVDEIEFARQATPASGTSYEPTFEFQHFHCWPDRPDWDQLVEGDELRALDEAERAAGRGGLDLESWWCPWTGTPGVLRRGIDYDDVVLAIPVGALAHIAGDIVSHHRDTWQPMLDHIKTTPTQHVQVWLDPELAELGWRRPQRFGSATWQPPFTDVVDLSDLIPYEGWPADDRPGSVLYFCGPLQDDPDVAPFTDAAYPQQVRDRVTATAAGWLRSLHDLLPGVRSDTDDFDFDLLHVPAAATSERGESRLRVQHVKANIDPNERYVLSLPGSNQYRLSAWGSGVDNLVLCGDWIDTGLNVGSFEAAVTSGMLASHALTGSPALEDVRGYAFLRTPPPAPSSGRLWPKR